MEHITESECIRIGLAGNLTEVEMARLCGRARALAPCGVRRVELDFSKVSYIGSSALGGLVYLHHLFGKRGVTLVVVAPLPEVLQELQTCGLAGLLRVQAAA